MPATGKKAKKENAIMYASVNLSTGFRFSRSHTKKKRSDPKATVAGPKKAMKPNLRIDLMRFSSDSCVIRCEASA